MNDFINAAEDPQILVNRLCVLQAQLDETANRLGLAYEREQEFRAKIAELERQSVYGHVPFRCGTCNAIHVNGGIVHCDRCYDKLLKECSLLKGTIAAGDEMQGAQLDQWREQLNIPEHIVAPSVHIVDDLCEYLSRSSLALTKLEQLITADKACLTFSALPPKTLSDKPIDRIEAAYRAWQSRA